MNTIRAAILGAQLNRRSHLLKGFSNAEELADENLAKGEGAEAEEDEDEQEENTEKSDILYALNHGDIKVTKTGKEIKEQVEKIILPELNAQLAVKESEALAKLKECGAAPTEEPDPWWTGEVKMDVGFKIYTWREREFRSVEQPRMFDTLSATDEAEKKGNCPTSEAEAKARDQYNEIVRHICNLKVDIKVSEMLRYLKDATDYTLTPKQVLVLRF